MNRREFRKAVKVEIIKRATVGSVIRCEECHVAVKRFEIHHLKADGLEIDKEGHLTASDGILLCCGPGSCHAAHTASDVPAIAKAKRREAAHLGATMPKKKLQSRGFQKRQRAHEGRASVPHPGIYK